MTGPLFPIDEESEENLTESEQHHELVGDPAAPAESCRSALEEMDRLEGDQRLLRSQLSHFQEQFQMLAGKMAMLEEVDAGLGSAVDASRNVQASDEDELRLQNESLMSRMQVMSICIEQSDASSQQLREQIESTSNRNNELVTTNQRMEQELADLNAKLQQLTSERSCDADRFAQENGQPPHASCATSPRRHTYPRGRQLLST